MSTQFFKQSLFSRVIACIVIANFILTSVPISAYCSNANTADSLRPSAVGDNGNPNAAALAEALSKQALSKKLVVDLKLLGKDDLMIGGGKAVNLGEMMRIAGIQVPPGYVTTPDAYLQFIREGVIEIKGKIIPLQKFIDDRLEGLDYNDAVALNHAGEDIRNAIRQAKMPAELEKKIREAYAKLGNVAVAVRSSATAEDSKDASFAGEQATFLNIRGADNVVERVRDCIASLFEDRAILYRHEKNISHSTTYLCAVVQKMATQKKAPTASGVMFSVNVVTGSRNQITIEATPGLGEKVVAGKGTPDTFLVNRSTGKPVIQNKTLVAKPDKIVYRDSASIKPGEEGTETVPTTPEERDNYCITDAQALQLATIALILEAHYGFIVDVEWVIDEEGQIWIVQVRPEVPWNTQARNYPNQKMVHTSRVVPKSAETATIATVGLSAGSRKAASGGVTVIKELKGVPEDVIANDLAAQMGAFPEGDILVAKMTNPSYFPAMKKAAAVVTDQGGRTCHAALVTRELGIPSVVGTSDATEKLANGMEVTVDGYSENGKVYKDKLPIERQDTIQDLNKIPTTHTKVKITTAESSEAVDAYLYTTLPSVDGVGLMRAEFALAKMPHILAGSDYDRYNDPNCPEDERRTIENKLSEKTRAEIKAAIDDANRTRHPKEQYKTFREYYIGTLAEAIMGVAAEQHRGQPVIYRTTDFKTNEYRRLIGGSAYEPQENNPMLGYRGLSRMLSPEYREAFEMEIEAIKKAREVFKNIWVMFPVCRSPEEIKAAEDLFAKHGLVRGQDGLKYIMMFEVPDDFFRMKKYLQYVDGFSIGSNDLTQLALGTGRDNGVLAVLGLFNANNPALLNMINVGIRIAKKEKKETGICGDEPSVNPPYTRHLVRAGIGSVSVTQDAVPRVEDEIKLAEEERDRLGGLEGVFDSEKAFQSAKHLFPDLYKYPVHIVDWEEFDTMGKPEKAVASSLDAAELIKEIGIHPLALMQYARGETTDTALKQQIEANLAGKSVKDFVVDTVYQAMKEKADRAPAGQMVVYTTDDLLMTDYRKLSGVGSFEFDDDNPITGIFGLVRVLSKEYRDFFAWQLEGLHKEYTEQPQRKFAIRFDGVIETKQIKDALDMVRAAGFEPGKNIQVGMELRTPGNVTNLKRFIKEGELNFLSENRDAFLVYNLALDPGSPYIDQPQANKDDSFETAQRYWTNIAQQMGIPLVQFDSGSLTPWEKSVKYGLGGGSQDADAENLPRVEIATDTSINGDGYNPLPGQVFLAKDGQHKQDKIVYDATSMRYGNFVNAVKESKDQGNVIMGANAILENAGAIAALKMLKGTSYNVVIWAQDEAMLEKLQAMGIEEVTKTLKSEERPEDLKYLLGMSRKNGIPTTLILSPLDRKDIDLGEIQKLGVQIVNLETPQAKEAARINSMPLVIARAITGIAKDDRIIKEFKELTKAYAESGQISAEDLAVVNDLTAQISTMPLVAVNQEIADTAEIYKTATEELGGEV